MTRNGARRPKGPHSRKQKATLEALEKAARRAGLRVSTGRLRYAGLRLKGGSCLFRGRRWIVMDRAQPFDDLLEIFRQVLPPEDLAEAGVLPLTAPALTAPARAAGADAAGADAAGVEAA